MTGSLEGISRKQGGGPRSPLMPNPRPSQRLRVTFTGTRWVSNRASAGN